MGQWYFTKTGRADHAYDGSGVYIVIKRMTKKIARAAVLYAVFVGWNWRMKILFFGRWNISRIQHFWLRHIKGQNKMGRFVLTDHRPHELAAELGALRQSATVFIALFLRQTQS